MAVKSAARVRDVPGFRRYVASRAVAWTGSAGTAVALPILVFQRTNSAALTGLLAAAESLPYLLFGLHVGALVDRWEGRRVMTIAALVTAVMLATVPVADWLGVLSTAQLLAVALIGGISYVFLDAAAFGTLPRIVGQDLIGAATALLSGVGTVIAIAIPGLVGIALPLFGSVPVIAVDAGLCALSALLLSGVVVAFPHEPTARGSGRLRRDILEGLEFVWRHPVIRSLTFLGFGNAFTGGAVTGLIVVVGVRHLGFSDDDGRLGWLYAMSALGSFVAATVIGRIQARIGVGLISQAGYALMALVVVAWATTTNWMVAAALLLLEGAVGTVIILNGIVTRQTLTPMRLQGRVNTTARVIAWGGAPFGAAVGGLLAQSFGVGPALYLSCAAIVMAFVLGLCWQLPRVGRLADLPRLETS